MPTRLAINLSQWSGFPIADVEYVIKSAPRRYKVFYIPKKRGGMREVAQPSKELKVLQNLLVRRVLHLLPVHDAAHGYVSGRGIKSNALAHVESNYLLKMDLEDFFPSIKPRDLRAHLRAYAPELLTPEEFSQAANLTYWRPKGERTLRMCIGAPSSPFLSNTIMLRIDEQIATAIESMGVTYTRYADDMAFSCREKNVLSLVQTRVTEIVESSLFPRVRINHAKTVHISRSQRRMLTGLVLSSTCNLSLGRDRKRLIKALVHRARLGQLGEDQVARLSGFLAFAHDVDPSFAAKMRLQLSLPYRPEE